MIDSSDDNSGKRVKIKCTPSTRGVKNNGNRNSTSYKKMKIIALSKKELDAPATHPESVLKFNFMNINFINPKKEFSL